MCFDTKAYRRGVERDRPYSELLCELTELVVSKVSRVKVYGTECGVLPGTRALTGYSLPLYVYF